MEKLKKILSQSFFWMIVITVYLLLISLFGYIGWFSLSTITKINFGLISIFMLIIGIRNGKKASKRGYLEGLKFGGLVVLVLFLMNLIFFRIFNLYLLLYYAIILVSSTIGSMIGINLKRS